MEKKIVCHKCRSILAPGSRICPQCGETITEADYVEDDTILLNPIYLLPGTVLHMKYRINGVIGQGGFGITYDGTDIKLDMHVAIKEYFPNPMASRQVTVSADVTCSSHTQSLYEQGLNNFLKEARNMAKYAGEDNFVAVHDYFAENNTAYIIMEFVEGENLKQYLQKHGRLTMEQSMPIIMPVMNALEKIHSRGMIHRDVSPSNIMILPDGRVRLLDFGAARDVSLETQNMTTMSAVFKHGYSPIEQLTQGMHQGPYTDIYALCATLYEMLTGSVPPSPFTRLYEGGRLIPPTQMGVRLNAVQEETILRGLAVNGAERIQTIAELRNGLIWNGAMGTPAPMQPENGSSNTLKIVLGAAIAVLALGIGAITVNQLTAKKPTPAPAEYVASEQSEASEEQQAEPEEPVESDVQETEQQQTVEQENSQPSNVEAESIGTIENRTEEEPAYDFPEGTLYYNGHHYYIYDDVRSSWTDASRKCNERGGYLAVINGPEENEELFQYMVDMGYDQAFFGMTDSIDEGDWIYISGDSSSYTDWGQNSEGVAEPNNAEDNENYAQLDVNMFEGHWNDARFGKKTYTPDGAAYQDLYAYICEWDF